MTDRIDRFLNREFGTYSAVSSLTSSVGYLHLCLQKADLVGDLRSQPDIGQLQCEYLACGDDTLVHIWWCGRTHTTANDAKC